MPSIVNSREKKKREKGRRTGPRLENVGCCCVPPMQPAELHHHTSSETCFSFPSDGQTDEEGRTDVQEKEREVPFWIWCEGGLDSVDGRDPKEKKKRPAKFALKVKVSLCCCCCFFLAFSLSLSLFLSTKSCCPVLSTHTQFTHRWKSMTLYIIEAKNK